MKRFSIAVYRIGFHGEPDLYVYKRHGETREEIEKNFKEEFPEYFSDGRLDKIEIYDDMSFMSYRPEPIIENEVTDDKLAGNT